MTAKSSALPPDDHLRGTGRTTRQMETAVQGAWFVWCGEDLYYPRMIAWKLKRPDIKILKRSEILPPCLRFRGQNIPELILDHDVKLSDAIVEGLKLVRPYVGRFND